MAENNADPTAMQKWIDAANNPPQRAPLDGAKEPIAQKGGKGGLKRSGKQIDGDGANAEKFVNLSSEVQGQFPDADLSKVTVILNSQEAADQGVEGFYKEGVIHIAPGADRAKVERHEAAHAAMAGGNNTKGDGETQSVEDSEKQAEKAEDGETMNAGDLGNADPQAQMNKDKDPTNLSDKGFPKIEWNGLKFDKVSGSFNKELLKSDWKKRTLIKPQPKIKWPIPCFPGGYLTVQANVDFEPSASMVAKANYAWNGKEFEVSGTLESELKGAVTGWVEGGIELDAVIQSGGVGLRAGLELSAATKLSRKIAFTVGEDGVKFNLTPLDFELGGALKGIITARAWTEGWIWNSAHEWVLSEMTIATLTGAKVEVGVDASKKGITGGLGTIKPGTFSWGSAPPITKHNGKEV